MTASSRALAGVLLVSLAGCTEPDPPTPAPPPSAVPTFRGSYEPIDDGASVPGFSRFRSELRDIVARKDTSALLARVASGARLSFGDDAGGPEGFRQMWFSGSTPEARDPWETLAGVLDAGSVEEDEAVTAPFVYGLWPDTVDVFGHVAIVGQDVPAYEGPSQDAEIVARLSYLIVPALAPPDRGWRMVRLPDSTVAYVSAQKALSPVGYRAAFWEDGGGRWRLQTFLAGD